MERGHTIENSVYYGKSLVRVHRDDSAGSFKWFCIDDLILAMVNRSRNQERAMDIIRINYGNELSQFDGCAETYLGYDPLKPAMEMLRNRRFFASDAFVTFLQWYEDNCPTVQVSEAEDEEWNEFIANRKRVRFDLEEDKNVPDEPYVPMEEEDEEEEDAEDFSNDDDDNDNNPTRLSPDEIKLRCTVLDSLANVWSKLDDGALKARMRVQITNVFNVIEHNLSQHPLYKEDNGRIVRVTARIKQLRPDVDIAKVRQHRLEVGELASDKYYEVYGIRPPLFIGWANGQRRPIRKYTENTSPQTLDVIIQSFDFGQ